MQATPLAVIPARSGRVPWEAGLFAATDQPVVVYTGPGGATPPASVRAPVEVVALADPAPGAMLADLRRRGVRALLSEGGPTVLGGFAAAGVIDELFVTIANVLVGEAGALRILEGPELAAPSRLALRGVLRSGDELYLRYRVHPG
jgi:riboflavin biosynthesis pyrimidine reductase